MQHTEHTGSDAFCALHCGAVALKHAQLRLCRRWRAALSMVLLLHWFSCGVCPETGLNCLPAVGCHKIFRSQGFLVAEWPQKGRMCELSAHTSHRDCEQHWQTGQCTEQPNPQRAS